MKRIFPLFALLLASFSAHANIGETFGFGSRSSALAGAGVAGVYDGFAACLNPAGVADLPRGKRIALSAGLTYNDPTFLAINDVVTGNAYTKGTTTQGAVDTNDYKATFGTVLGASFLLSPEFYSATFGVTAFLPVNQLAFLDTGRVFEPEYVLYRARTQRPQIYVAGAIEPSSGLRLGAGLQVAFKVSTSADVILLGNAQSTSSMRLSATLKPFVVPYFGIQYAPKNEEETGAYSLGLTLRPPAESKGDISLTADVQASPAVFTFNAQALSMLYYDPWSLETGLTYRYSQWGRAYAQVDLQAWNLYQQPALAIPDPSSSIVLQKAQLSPANTRNIWIPRLANEIKTGNITWRAGYSYRPSIFRDVPNNVGNLLDPSRHIMTLGFGVLFQKFLGFESPWTLDLHVAHHRLVRQQINKTAGDELGNTSASKVGSPGYSAGGHLWGGGLSLSLSI